MGRGTSRKSYTCQETICWTERSALPALLPPCSNIRREKFPAAIEQHPRVLLLPFAPQRALLAHPAVSLFVSHGGAESSHEAMYDGVPMLILSFFG